MKSKRNLGLIVGIISGFLLVILFGMNLLSNNEQQNNSEQLAVQVNQQFVEKFFSYTSTGERYEGIKDFMTEQGYRSLFPSGIEIPKDSQVKSTMTDLRIYVQQEPPANENQLEILNNFMVSTEFGGIQSSKEIVMRSIMIKEGSIWKINEIEMIVQNSNE